MCGKLFRVAKFHVHHGTDYLNDISCIHDCELGTESHLRGGDFEQLGRDAGLAHLIVFERQVFDELMRVVRRVFHRDHARAVFRRAGVENHLVNLVLDVIRAACNRAPNSALGSNKISQHRIAMLLHRRFFLRALRCSEIADRQQSLHDRTLIDGVDEMRV